MDPSPPEDPKEPRRNAWAIAFSTGSELVVSVLAGFFAGRWADKKFGTQPWLLLLGIFSGISLGLYQLIREASGRPGSSS